MMRGKSASATRRDVLIGGAGLLCAGAGVAAARETAVEPLPEGVLEEATPQGFGAWRAIPASGVVLPAESELSDKIYNDVMVRAYQNDRGAAVTLLLAYGASQGPEMQLHRPEACYPAAGFAIKDTQPVNLPLAGGPSINAKLLDTESPARREQVLYWTRVGDRFPTSPMEQRWAVVRQNFAGNVPDGILVRTSLQASDAEAALPVLRSFVTAMVDGAPAPFRRLLVGPA
jgi:EpsI family protein